MITGKTTLAELQALREQLDISSLLVTVLRDAVDPKVKIVEVMALTTVGVAKGSGPTFADALDVAFKLCAQPVKPAWRTKRAESNEGTEQRAKRIGHDVRTISAGRTYRCQCGAELQGDDAYAEHVWSQP